MAEPVLVVDDNQANAALVMALLTAFGYEVRVAASAEAMWRTLETFTPRLVLMDVQLPDADGLELTRRLRQAPETKDLVVVALTAQAMAGDADKALAAGCDGYVTKPIDTRRLPATIAELLRRRGA